MHIIRRILFVLLCGLFFASCSSVQERPENFPAAAFNTWQERYPNGNFTSSSVTTHGDGSPNLYTLETEEGQGARILTMFEDGTIRDNRYEEELLPDKLPEAVLSVLTKEYPDGDISKTVLVIRNDTTEYAVTVDLPNREDLPKFRIHDDLVFSPEGIIKHRANTATTVDKHQAPPGAKRDVGIR